MRERGARLATAGRRALAHLQSPVAWVALALIVVVVLAVGSVHSRPPSRTERIAQLESVIKCPTCVDESIAQSTSLTAATLRREVRADVDKGWSNARIESWVTTNVAADEILVPADSGLGVLAWVLPILACAIAVVALACFFVVRRHRAGDGAPVARDDEALVATALRAAPGGRGEGS